MLFLVFGASCAGKTTALAELRRRELDALAIHDHDEIGVPAAPDTAWRQRTIEEWLQRVLEYQARGIDVVLAGQTPFAELFAEPSAPLLDGAAAASSTAATRRESGDSFGSRTTIRGGGRRRTRWTTTSPGPR